MGAQEHREGIVSYLWRHGLRKRERDRRRKEGGEGKRKKEGGRVFIQ